VPVPISENGELDMAVSEGGGAAREVDMTLGYDNEVGTEHVINAALRDVWSGLHHDDNNGHDENEKDGGEIIEEDPEGWKLYNGWDDHKDGLMALDLPGEDFVCGAVANGELICNHMRTSAHCSNIAGNLSERDMLILQVYAFKINEHLTDEVFAKIPYAFLKDPVPTVKVCRSWLQALSGFRPVRYDCCINSCWCFAGDHRDRTNCPYCGQDRWVINHRGRKKSQKVLNYLPFIPRLVAMQANPIKATEMRYQAFEHAPTPGKVTDVFDSHVYRRLLGKKVIINGKLALHKYFSDPHDVALGLSTDGFCPFWWRQATAWPLLLFNYNLPPEMRFHKDNKLDLGTIPGPNKPKDFDSFAWPTFEEFVHLQHGVRAFDALTDEFFLLRTYLFLVFGNIPAMSMVMHMTGHNGFSPCCMCKILSVQIPDSTNNTYYVLLDRSLHPDVAESESAPTIYDAVNLPLRTEDEMLGQARAVQDASSKTQKSRLSKAYGIKGVSLLSNLKSLSFPLSFPYNFMHLIWENLIPNLILLWTGGFKGLDKGVGEHQFLPNIWESIAAATAAAGSIIPSAFGAQPPNPATQRSLYSAEAWSIWMLYL
jgi:hypothetical protein